MIKKMINIIAILLTIFSLITVLQYFQLEEQKYPFNTNGSLSFDMTENQGNKPEIIESLNKVVNKHNAVFIKTGANIKDYQNKKDIIWFGSKNPPANNPMLIDSQIRWLGGKLSGDLIRSNMMGERVLSGHYSYITNDDFIMDLKEWAKEHNIQLKIENKASIFLKVYVLFFLNGFGNGILTSLIFLITVILLWFVEHAKARSIRLIGGVSVRKIHIDDVCEIAASVMVGEIIGGIITVLLLLYKQGLMLTKTLFVPFTLCFLIILISTILICFILSLLASPKAKHIAERKIPLQRFNLLSKVNRFIAMLLAFIVLPITLQGLILTKNLLEEHKIWNENNSIVRINYSDDDALVNEEIFPKTQKFFEDSYNAKILTVSYVLDKGIVIEPDILGNYDHIVITDKLWADSINVGIGSSKENGKLLEVKYSELNTPLKEYLDMQLPVLTNSGEATPEGMKFYKFEGKYFTALPPEVGRGEKTIQAKNPLVILVENPVKMFKVRGFLLDSLSTGNVVFKDLDKLKLILEKSEINAFISSVDNVAEQSLEMAQQFSQQMMAYIISSIVVFISIILMSGLKGRIWVIQNKKRIFTLHTSGMSFKKIIGIPMKGEFLTSILMVACGTIATYFIHHTNFSILISVAVIVVITQILSGMLIYRYHSKKEFIETVNRR